MCKKLISIIGLVTLILTIADGCISITFQNGLRTEDSVEVKFETPINPERATDFTATIAPIQTVVTLSPPAEPTALLSTSTPTLRIGSTIVGKDGMTLLYVPAGTFVMGTKTADALAECQKFAQVCSLQLLEREDPPHEVHLDAFWIDRTEVTNALYAQCVKTSNCQPPSSTTILSTIPRIGGYFYYGNSQFDNYPVVYVSWSDAQAYCSWAGRRLPTEAEWEKAARGTDGRTYPWGNESPNLTLLNHNYIAQEYTSEVGKYPSDKSPYGALDMGGNVEEWVADWYGETYYANSPTSNPAGPEEGGLRIVRGGSWLSDPEYVHSAVRSVASPADERQTLGFRCAANALP